MEPQATNRRQRRVRVKYNADRRSIRNWFPRWNELDLQTQVLWLKPPASGSRLRSKGLSWDDWD